MTSRTRPVPAETLPYRPCAGMMVLNRDGLVWIGRRMKEGNTEYSGAPLLWQMPQGGIDPGEDPLPAARRELFEETGIETVELIERAPRVIRYDLPPHMMGIGLKGRYRGQEQHWFAFRFLGDESEIRINPPPDGHKPEFDAWKWTDMATLADNIVDFKRDAYRQVVAMFGHLAGTRA
ncbi:MAG: RNA pyrophosphohydrolase [Roseitalea porphyridii]|jgi:putative (di)nucleoside polyphosphate hydrolase|uniref:RNA pyrophosphohydrolase n=1 Tax=Roseitalea porphyridii TaxID=1852022 RepID=UPI0032EC534D